MSSDYQDADMFWTSIVRLGRDSPLITKYFKLCFGEWESWCGYVDIRNSFLCYDSYGMINRLYFKVHIRGRFFIPYLLFMLHLDDSPQWVSLFSSIATSSYSHGLHTASWVSREESKIYSPAATSEADQESQHGAAGNM